MVVARGPALAAVLLLLSSGHYCLSPPPLCPDLCTCQSDPALLNCSSAGLYLVPQHIQASVTELHLSHNHLPSVALDQPLRKLRALRLDNNSITHLSLCLDRTPGGGRGHRMRPWGRQGCDSWAPTLQLLSVERNQLQQLPEGLEGSTLLQVLHVSFNRISSLRPGQFSRLRQLTELHLQHNLITNLHPQIFQDLTQLRVLDLSFNMLTGLHPLMHLSLHNIGTEVTLAGNKWHCDCSLRSLRRRMVYDRNRGLKAWNVVCASPSILSGRDLLQVEESELNCFSTENNSELHQDITVYRGSEILLSCSAQDSTWLTPNGQVPVGDHRAGLHISDITEGDTGLYVCVSKENNILSVFNLQISRNKGTKRKARSLPRTDGQISQDVSDRMIQERNQGATQSNLAVAVCLSVFITFFVAFIIGVIARPWLDHLWRRITKKNSPPEITVVSVAEQRQYDNQAFSCCEEPGGVCTHQERRVTFCSVDIDENSNAQQYDNHRQENRDKYEAGKADRNAHKAGDPGSETSSQSSQEENRRNGRTGAGLSKNTKLEYIQETNGPKNRRRHSSSSDSSVFDKVFTGNRIKPSQVSEDFIQQRAPEWKGKDVPKTSMDGNENFGCSSEPFDDWSPHAERFEFSDSFRSVSSSGSVSRSLKNSKQTGKKKRNDKLSSNSSSCLSENEIPEHTVNPGQEEVMKWNDNSPEDAKYIKNSVSFQQRSGESAVISPGLQGDYRCDTQSHAKRPKPSVSSYSSDSEDNTIKQRNSAKDEKYSSDIVTGEKDAQQKVVPLPRTKLPGSFVVSSHGKSLDTKKPPTPAVYSSSSSSESELKPIRQKMKQKRNKVNPGAKVKASGIIKETSSDSDWSSSRGSKVEISQVQRQELTAAPRPSVKASQTVGSDHHWPAIDLQHTTRVKRRLDIKVKSSGSQSSSSSDSEDETNHMKKQDQWQTPTPRLPSTKGSQTAGPDHHWPAINLEHVTKVKRRLDLKVKSHDSDSSSSSDSEDETNLIKKKEQWETSTRLPVKVSPIGTPDQPWPAIDLLQKTRVKRRLDIKAPSPKSDTSSSNDSEDDRGPSGKRRPGKGHITKTPFEDSSSSSNSEEETPHSIKTVEHWVAPTSRLPIKEPQIMNPDQHWPAVDLQHRARLKRRLDIKIRSPDLHSSFSSVSKVSTKVNVTQPPFHKSSSSSSDSEDDTRRMTKQEQWHPSTTILLNYTPPTGGSEQQWPAVNLEQTTKVKRRLDVKAPSPKSDTSSSSDSEDDQKEKERPGVVHVSQRSIQKSQSSSSSDSDDDTSHITKQDQRQTSTPRHPPIKVSQTVSPAHHWPAVNLEHMTKVKRRLAIKVASDNSESSSSSDSEDEISHNAKEKQWQTSSTRVPVNTSPTGSPGQQWPAINLEWTKKVKRRLDIRAPSIKPDKSSSSDSEDDQGPSEKQKPGKAHVSQHSIRESHSSSSSDSEHETRQIKKQEQWQTSTNRLPSTPSPTGRPDLQWPAINLQKTTKVKRRLDIRITSFNLDTSSSSDSEDDRAHGDKQRPGKAGVTQFPIQESQSSSSGDSEDETRRIIKQEQWQTSTARVPINTPTGRPDSQWPAINLGQTTKVKRRLDIKAPSPKSDTSSSSDSEDDQGHKEKQRPGGVDVSQCPLRESHSSSSSDNEEETSHIIKQEQWQTSKRLPNSASITAHPDLQWLAINLQKTTKVKRRLDIKVRSSDSESSFGSDREGTGNIKKQEQSQINMPRLSFQEHYSPHIMWPQLDLLNLKHVKRRLDIKAPSYDSDSSSSSSDSEDEKGDRAKPGLGVSIASSNTPKDFIKFSMMPLIHTSSKPKTDDNIKLENYTIINDTSDKISGNTNKTPEVSPELESLWEKMNLGKSRFRKHIKITSRKQETANPLLSPPPVSPHYTSYDRGTESKFSTRRAEGITHIESLLEPEDKVQQEIRSMSVERQRKDSSPSSDSSSSDEEEDMPKKDLGEGWRGHAQSSSQIYPSPDQSRSQTQEVKNQMGMDLKIPAESGPLQSHIVLTNIPRVRRALNIRAPSQLESSSDINSKPDLSHGIPYTARPLNNKVPAPSSSSSSSSESENETTENTAKQDRKGADILGQTHSPITYERSIFKSSSLLGSSTLPMPYRKHPEAKVGTDEVEGLSRHQGSTEAFLRPKTFPSTSFEEIIKTRTAQSRTTKGVEVPPEIKWNGIGRRLTPISNLSTTDESTLTPRQEPTKTELSLSDSSTSSEDDYNIKRGRSDEVLIPQQWTQCVSNDPVSGRNLDKFNTSPSGPNEILRVESDNRRERKGLNALKAMSSERKKWDTHSDSVPSPQFNGYDSPISTRFGTGSAKEHKPQTQLPPHSHAGHVEGVQNFMYGIPVYRRHAIVATTPPAVPATPPPDEVHIPAWRSPQSHERVLDVRTQPYQSRNTGESSPYNVEEHFDNPYNNISRV